MSKNSTGLLLDPEPTWRYCGDRNKRRRYSRKGNLITKSELDRRNEQRLLSKNTGDKLRPIKGYVLPNCVLSSGLFSQYCKTFHIAKVKRIPRII